ncbi:free fatty acid receptor 1 [Trichosurus vulpecula]|uniref:free fatty acid receptor 1 n=1 Tax=Trichosurus vulpecula TaxID=9337 RepID=UPI00186B0CB9|nr:free fatty acid receptor 1 [Trichosurus vulpecula]
MDIPPQLSFALYAAAFILGLPLNIMLLSEAVSHARLRLTPSLVYILHLACSDLLLTTSLPLKAAEALAGGAWPLPASLCPAFALIHFVPLYAGGILLAALSVGRYLGAAFPLGYQAVRRPCYSWGVCVGIWGLVLFHLGLVFGLESQESQEKNNTNFLGMTIPINGSPICLEAWDPIWAGPARFSISLLLFFLPLVITTFCYMGCLRALAHSGLSRSRKLRAARVAGGALLTLLLCLGPYNASHVANFVKPEAGNHWRKLGLIMGSWSCVLNPLVSGYLGNKPGQRHGTVGTQVGAAQK